MAVKKLRKKRTMTPEQKAAAAERLRKAREAKGPAQNLSIAESVRNLPDDDLLSAPNVRKWIKTNKDRLANIKSYRTSNDRKERAEYQRAEIYVSNLQSYLRDGIYKDLFYGEFMEGQIKYRCVVPAYYQEGNMKRTVGVFYKDVGEWTQEMDEALRG